MTDNSPKGERIAKVIARAGYTSRRGAEGLISEGKIAVNGKPITSPALNVTDKDQITIDGKAIGNADSTRLWLYHKTTGTVCTHQDEAGRSTIFDTLPEGFPRVMSVGRLDLNSEGLILLTNDGALKRHLELPKTGLMRRYRVRVNGTVRDEMLEKLREGITAQGVRYQPMEVVFDQQKRANAWLTVGLREGKNREIRHAMNAVGLLVNRLIRISYGPFQLGQLAKGSVEEIRRKIIRDQFGHALNIGIQEPNLKPAPRGPARQKSKSKPRQR